MKLLFDENLSPRLVQLVPAGFPGSVHVRDVGLKGHVDADLWELARRSGFTIVSKDTDFRERSYVEGFPPKVIWLDVGNAAQRLGQGRREHPAIRDLAAGPADGLRCTKVRLCSDDRLVRCGRVSLSQGGVMCAYYVSPQ